MDNLVCSMSWHWMSLSMGRVGTSMGLNTSLPPSLTILEVSRGQLCCISCRVICTKPNNKILPLLLCGTLIMIRSYLYPGQPWCV